VKRESKVVVEMLEGTFSARPCLGVGSPIGLRTSPLLDVPGSNAARWKGLDRSGGCYRRDGEGMAGGGRGRDSWTDHSVFPLGLLLLVKEIER
jgi:hypothetical protein